MWSCIAGYVATSCGQVGQWRKWQYSGNGVCGQSGGQLALKKVQDSKTNVASNTFAKNKEKNRKGCVCLCFANVLWCKAMNQVCL